MKAGPNPLVTPFTFYKTDDKGLLFNSWVATVKSPVPTTGIKSTLIVKPKSFVLDPVDADNPSMGWKLNGNSLKLLRFKIDKIIKNGELQPGSCILSNDPASCGLVSNEAQLRGGGDNGSTPLNFKPIVLLKKFTSEGERYIQAISGVNANINAEMSYLGGAGALFTPNNISAQFLISAYEIADAGNQFIYEWLDTGTGSISNVTDPTTKPDSTLTLPAVSGFLDVLLDFAARPILGANITDADDYTGQTSLIGLIKYTWKGRNILFLPDALPDTQSEGIFNPGADIVGLIYSKVLDIPKEANKYYSTGNLTSNVLRDTVMANLASLPTTNLNNSQDLIISNSCPSNDNKATSKMGNDSFYYVQGQDVILGDSAGGQMDCGRRNNIVVVKGGNVFIDANLFSTEQGRGKWTIVALRSNYGIESFKQGGNIYINKEVQNIQANIMADGSLFSYQGEKNEANFQVDGRPKTQLTDEDLQKQLYILGSVASWNTFGGSLKVANRPGATDPTKPYVLGNGQFTSDQELARVYDLNYLRRFKLYLERYNGVVIDQFCKNKPQVECGGKACSVEQQAQLVNAGNRPACYDIDATLEYDPTFDTEEDSGGDLITVNQSGEELRAPALIPFSSAPVVIKYEQPDPNNPLFKVKNGGAFVRPNF